MRNLKEIRVVDSCTVRMILDQPDALILHKTVIGPKSGWIIGAPRYMEEVGWEGFLRRPVGTGPYMVESEIRDYREIEEGQVYATLVANPNYWKTGHPKIRRISFVQASPKWSLDALIEGRVDLLTSLIPKDTLRVAKSLQANVVKGREDVTFTIGHMNLMSPHTFPLRDIRVRKALNYGINKEELMRYAFKGNAERMKGVLTEKSGIDLSATEPYDWNVPKARELLKEAGYGKGLKIKVFYQEKDYLIARLLRRFYSLLKIDVEATAIPWEWGVTHFAYPNTRKGYSWDDEDWWIAIVGEPAMLSELMFGFLEWNYHSGAPFQPFPDYLMLPLNEMYQELLRTKNRAERFQIYKRANEYVADQAFGLFMMGPLGLYGVNKQLSFIPQVSQYLYLDYCSVTDKHWSLEGKR